MKQSGALAEHFVGGVAGDALEDAVDEDDAAIVGAVAGVFDDEDDVVGVLDAGFEKAESRGVEAQSLL